MGFLLNIKNPGMQTKVVSWCSIWITNVRRYYTLLKEEEVEIHCCALWSIKYILWEEFCSPQVLSNMEIDCVTVEGR